MDILLDCDQGKMEVQLISDLNIKDEKQVDYYGGTAKKKVIKCWNMPSKQNDYNNNEDFKGYVPHFNISGKGIILKCAKMPVDYYGIHDSLDIFSDI